MFVVVKANGALFWLGNTLGGVVGYWMGYGAKQAFARERDSCWFGSLQRYGAKTMLLGRLPGIGDPICTLVAGLAIVRLRSRQVAFFTRIVRPRAAWRT